MANSLNITNQNYAGKYAAEIISLMIASGVMFDRTRNMSSIYEYVKQKMKVPLMKLDDVIKPYTTKFVASGEVILSDKELDPQAHSVHLEFPIDVLEQTFMSEAMTPGMMNSDGTPDFETWLITYIARQLAKEVDNYVWNSDTASLDPNLALIDGLLVQLLADPDTIPVIGTTLTATNIIDELSKVYDALPEDLDGEDIVFVVSSQTKRLYRQKLANQGFVNVANMGVNGDLIYEDNIRIVSVPMFPANTIVAYNPQNVALGTDLTSDINNIWINNMLPITGDREIRVRADFKLDAKYGFAEQIVLYS